MKYYQMVVIGSMEIFNGSQKFYSGDIYSDKSMITDEIKQSFIKRCITPKNDHDMLYLSNDKNLEFFIVELTAIK